MYPWTKYHNKMNRDASLELDRSGSDEAGRPCCHPTHSSVLHSWVSHVGDRSAIPSSKSEEEDYSQVLFSKAVCTCLLGFHLDYSEALTLPGLQEE